MKKFISILVAAVMLAALIPATVNADDDYVISGDNGHVIVPYTTGDGITIDGTLAQGEWSETNKLSLDGTTTMKSWGLGVFEGHIDFYYSWGDKGLYMAAIVQDPDVADGAAQDETTLSTRFQIALNPAGIICDEYMGLFFSVCPVVDSDIVTLTRHNYELSDNGMVMVEAGEEGYEGKYTFITEGEEVIGWNMECVVPWAFIATPDRYADLDDTDTIELTNFNPKDENRKRAFCTATIAYVPCNTSTGGVCGTARTCTDGDPSIWTIDSYDLILHFALPDEINNPVTETEYFQPTAPDDTTAEQTTEANTTEADTTTEATTTEADTTTEAANTTDKTADTTKTPETTKDNGSQGGPNTGIIIGIIIAAVVAVAAIVAAIVFSKKKKK